MQVYFRKEIFVAFKNICNLSVTFLTFDTGLLRWWTFKTKTLRHKKKKQDVIFRRHSLRDFIDIENSSKEIVFYPTIS